MVEIADSDGQHVLQFRECLGLIDDGQFPRARLRVDDRRAYLWTRGLIPDLGTYPGREVPRPLSIEVVNGPTDLSVVIEDLLMLTKLNFNACIYGDGSPVTLRFADAVGEIITAVPERLSAQANIPLPFKRYI